MLEVIQRSLNFFRSMRVQSLDDFVVLLKRLHCTSMTAELLAENYTATTFRCTIYFSAEKGGRYVIYRQLFLWSKKILGIAPDLSSETRDTLSARLCLVARTELIRVRREIPDIQVSITDLDGDRWTLDDSGKWIRAGKRVEE